MRPLLSTLLTCLAVVVPCGAGAAQSSFDPPLTEDQAAELEPALEAGLVLDAAKPRRDRLARLDRRCRRLPVADALLAAFRSSCRTESEAYTAGLRLPTCRTTNRCRARLHRYAVALGRQARSARRLNGVLAREVPDPECRRALRVTHRMLVTVTRLARTATRLERAIATGSSAGVARQIRRFYAIDRSPLHDHRGRFDAFRASCL